MKNALFVFYLKTIVKQNNRNFFEDAAKNCFYFKEMKPINCILSPGYHLNMLHPIQDDHVFSKVKRWNKAGGV